MLQAPSTMFVALVSFVLAVALQLGSELLVQRNAVKSNNKRKLMTPNKHGRNAVSRKQLVTNAVMRVMAGVATGICGRCLLP